MTPLRQKRIDELQLRGFSLHTQDASVRSVAGLAQHYHRSPDQIEDGEIKAYLLYLLRIKQLAVSSLIVAVSALRFFFGQVLHRPTEAIAPALPSMKKPILRPKVYSVQELEQLFGQPELNRQHRALLMTPQAAGLRVSEVCQLRIPDRLSDRHQIHVVQGKGSQDRYTVFSPRLRAELQTYGRLYRPKDWLFPSRVYPDRHLTVDAVERAFTQAGQRAGLPERGGIPSLRQNAECREMPSGNHESG